MSVEPSAISYGISPVGRIAAREERFGIRHRNLADALRRAALYALTAYLPFVLAGLFERLRMGRWATEMISFDTHVRTLIALPILLIAEHVVDVAAHKATAYLVAAGIVQGDALVRYQALVGKLAVLRDSTAAETGLFAIALGFAALHVQPVAGMTAPGYGVGMIVMLTLFRFVLLRWLWSWTLWSVFLARVSRLPLRLTATHPDRMGGLGVLLLPSQAFALVAAGGSTAIASSWANRIVYAHTPTAGFQLAAFVYVAVMLLIAVAPLWFFSGSLYRVRQQGLVYYGAFAQHFGAAFDAWSRSQQLGPGSINAPEISAMTDLGSTYDRAATMQSMLWSRGLLASLALGGALPMVPLLLVEKRVPELLMELLKALT